MERGRRFADVDFPKVKSEETFLSDIRVWIEQGGSHLAVRPLLGWTLLHLAAEWQCVEAIEFLVGLGCDVNVTDDSSQTPLHIAVDSEIDATIQDGGPLTFKTTKRLLELGADLNFKNSRGETPMDCVNSYGEKARARFKEVIGDPTAA